MPIAYAYYFSSTIFFSIEPNTQNLGDDSNDYFHLFTLLRSNIHGKVK